MLHIGKKHRTEVVVNKWPGFFGHRVLRSHKNPGAPAPPFHYEIGPQNTIIRRQKFALHPGVEPGSHA